MGAQHVEIACFGEGLRNQSPDSFYGNCAEEENGKSIQNPSSRLSWEPLREPCCAPENRQYDRENRNDPKVDEIDLEYGDEPIKDLFVEAGGFID